MRVLLDTHIFLWWITDDARLAAPLRSALGAPGVSLFWSVASTWEVAVKYAIGRLPLAEAPGPLLARHRQLNRVELVRIGEDHALLAAALPRHHDDPFDRLLVAQAKLEGMTLATADARVREYDVPLLPPRRSTG